MIKPISLKKAVEIRAKIEQDREHLEKWTKYMSEAEVAGYRREIDALTEEMQPQIDALTAALDNVQKRCTARTISAGDILGTLASVEARLDVPKKYLAGVTIDADIHAQAFPSAYKYTPESTVFHAEYKAGSWRVTYIARDCCRRSPAVILTLPEETKNAVIKRLCSMEV